jgi:general secretion pathway protein M
MLYLSPSVRRLLALAILAGLLLLGTSGVTWVVDQRQESQNAAEQLQAAITRRDQTTSKVAQLEAELTQLKQHQTSAVGFLQSGNESLAAAELQSRVKSSVEAVHGELRSTQILPGREESGFRRVAIRGSIAVDIRQLQRIFYQLESSTPFLFLDNVEIRARSVSRGRGAGQGDNPMLDVRFDVYGYLRRAT